MRGWMVGDGLRNGGEQGVGRGRRIEEGWPRGAERRQGEMAT